MTKAGPFGSVPYHVGLAIFDMISIPPLDGYLVLSDLFRPAQRLTIRQTERTPVIMLLGLVFAGAGGWVAEAMIRKRKAILL